MKKKEYITIVFERGDYVELYQGIFIYLGDGLWMDRDSHALYRGSSTTMFEKGKNLKLVLFYICEGKIVNHLLEGIPEQKDVYVRK